MIRYSKKIMQEFLCPELCEKLKAAGIDFSDATYYIYKNDGTFYLNDNIIDKTLNNEIFEYITPTYSLSELIYKLNNYAYIGEIKAQLTFWKDDSFCGWYYESKNLKEGEEDPFSKTKNIQ